MHHTIISYYDLFPGGLGLDLAGAVTLATSLFTSPRKYAQRMVRSRNRFARFSIETAEARADTRGVVILVLGFFAQGFAYVLYISGK